MPIFFNGENCDYNNKQDKDTSQSTSVYNNNLCFEKKNYLQIPFPFTKIIQKLKG